MTKDVDGNDLTEDKVFIVAQGMLNCWVCAPKTMTIEQVQEGVTRDCPPAGTTNGWQVEARDSEEEDMRSPGICAEDCNRQHWVAYC